MNDYQKTRFANTIVSSMFNTVSGKKIAVLGFAFKKDTGDTRESASIDVCNALLEERAKLAIHDPKVSEEQIYLDLGESVKGKIILDSDPYEACKDSHAIAIMTEWDSFKSLDYKRIFQTMQKPAFIFDGRNILDHGALREIGFTVWAVGKAQPLTV